MIVNGCPPTMRPLFTCLLSLLASAPLPGQNREILAEYKIGVVGRDQEDAIYQAAHLGAIDAARALSEEYSIDVEVVVMTPDTARGDSQTNSLGRLFVEDADGLIISPSDPETIGPAVEFAKRQGQSVIFFEQSISGVEPLASVVADETEAGRLAARAILPRLPTKGRVAILTAKDPGPELEARLQGARQTLGYRRIYGIVESEPDYFAAIQAIRDAEEADRNHLIKGWLFLDDWPLLGMPALPWEPGDLPVVAIQSSPSAFLYIDQGYVDALVVHPYYDWGHTSMETLVKKLYRDVEPESRTIVTAPRVVDWRTVEDYRESWKAWLK